MGRSPKTSRPSTAVDYHFLQEIMSDTTATKKATKPRAPPTHPTYKVMIAKAIAEAKSRTGVSRIALAKYIEANYKVDKATLPVHLRLQLRKLVAQGFLAQTGQSFKVSAEGKAALKDAAAKVKKAEKKAKKATDGQSKKTTEKKSTEKKAASKSAASKESAKKAPAKPKTATKSKAPKAKTASKPKAASKPKTASKPKGTKTVKKAAVAKQ